MAPAEPDHPKFELQGEEPNFPEERPGWKGYIEWENYPEKKKAAQEVLARYDFPVVPSPVQNQINSSDPISLQNSNSSLSQIRIRSWRE